MAAENPLYRQPGSLAWTVLLYRLQGVTGTCGIKLEHVEELVTMGVRRIAVVTALTQAKDIARETGRWIEAIDKAAGQ